MVAAARGDVQMLRSLVQSGIPVDAYGSVHDQDAPGTQVECTALQVVIVIVIVQ